MAQYFNKVQKNIPQISFFLKGIQSTTLNIINHHREIPFMTIKGNRGHPTYATSET